LTLSNSFKLILEFFKFSQRVSKAILKDKIFELIKHLFEYLEKRDYSFRHISKQDFLDNFEFIKRKYLAQLHDFIDEGIFDLDDTMLNVHDKVQYNVALELKENKKWKRLLKKNKDK